MSRAFKVNLGIKDLQQQLGKIKQYDAQTQAKMRGAVQESTANIYAGAKRRVRVRSGGLQKNITMEYNDATNTGKVRAKSPHAHLVEFGARAAVERPKSKKALRIDANGIRRFADSVTIPARKAKPFMTPAFEQEKPNLMRNVQEAVKP